ncbi:MAG TPA: tyrosine-type recombinase/integrase [Candidatus Binatia bacterium]|nr:tyrosine-type recombinase/integrase [Candidatus Binatia bacterium]
MPRTYGTGSFWVSGKTTLYYRIWIDGARYQFNLGKVKDFPTHKDREKAAREYLAKLPSTSPKEMRSVSLATFIERSYLPEAKAAVRASTYNEYKGMFERHIKKLATKPIRHYDTARVQDLLDTIADPSMSITSLRHIRALLSGIFRWAKKKGLYSGENPVRDCTLASGLKSPRQTAAYTLTEVNAVLAQLESNLQARAIVAVAAFSGLRRSEIAGLRWPDWNGDQLHVRRSVFNGIENDTKSPASKNWVPVLPELRSILEAYKAECMADVCWLEESRMFIHTLDHFARKHICPAFKRAGVAWRGFHAFRRGVATAMHESGVSDITIMRALRHSSLAVTVNSYVKVRDGLLERAFQDGMGLKQRENNS